MEKEKVNFSPKQWVLVRDEDDQVWSLDIFSHYEGKDVYLYHCIGDAYTQCIPYYGNEKLLGETVSPGKSTEFKDGDFLAGDNIVFILDGHGEYKTSIKCCCWKRVCSDLSFGGAACMDRIEEVRPATESEKKLLLSVMHLNGKDWDAENKKIVDFKKPYEPKDGDFICFGGDGIGIFKDREHISHSDYADYRPLYDKVVLNEGGWTMDNLRLATEEEKQFLLSRLHEIGKDWDAENKKVVDYKWKPKKDEEYYAPGYDPDFIPSFIPDVWNWDNDRTDKSWWKRGWVCKTEEECQKLCDRLEEAIGNVK